MESNNTDLKEVPDGQNLINTEKDFQEENKTKPNVTKRKRSLTENSPTCSNEEVSQTNDFNVSEEKQELYVGRDQDSEKRSLEDNLLKEQIETTHQFTFFKNESISDTFQSESDNAEDECDIPEDETPQEYLQRKVKEAIDQATGRHKESKQYPQKELTQYEEKFLDIAFKFAYEALSVLEVPVGCIFVYNEKIIAKGRNTVNETRNATRHAEMNCIDEVVEYCKSNNLDWNKIFCEIDVFVTVEPCIMCAAALYELKIRSVIFGCKNDRFGGRTVLDVGSLLQPSTKLYGGYRAEEAMNLLKEFYQGRNPNAPPSKVKTRKKIERKPVDEQ